MRVIPDKFVLLNVNNDITIEKVKRNLSSEEGQIKYNPGELNKLARQALEEYLL